MRKYDIALISPSVIPTSPSVITLDGIVGDVTASFHGKEWIDELGVRQPFYTYDTDPLSLTPPPPYGTTVLIATSFDLGGNNKYQGRYTVYTTTVVGGLAPSEFNGSSTLIRVNEALATDGVGTELTTGYVANISTFVLSIQGESPLLLLEQQHNDSRPIELLGHQSSGWGEVFHQNLIRQVQSFAGPSAPLSGYLGQLWFNTGDNVLYARTTLNTWAPVTDQYRYSTATPSLTWTITHNFALAAPYVVEAQFFIDIGSGVYKPISPADVTYAANSITVTFSTMQLGIAILRGPMHATL